MTTRGTLKTDLGNWFDKTLDETTFKMILRMLEAQLARDIRVRGMVAELEAFPLQSQGPNGPVQRLLEILSITFVGSEKELTLMNAKQMRELPEFYETGTPRYYSMEGDALWFAPAPAADATLEIQIIYYRRFPTLVDDPNISTNWLWTNHYDLVQALGLSIYARYIRDKESAARYLQRYEQAAHRLHVADHDQLEMGDPTQSIGGHIV